MDLSLRFENNRTGHKDLLLRFAGQMWVCDTYYLALDYALLPEQEDADKIRAVLQRLLEQWLSAVANLADGSAVYLPYDFSDQYTACLRCVRAGDIATVCRGWSEIEGWSIAPSALGDYLTNVPDFRLEGPTVQISMRELIEIITDLVTRNA